MSMIEMTEPGQHLQRKRRSGRYYTDDHGRKFFAMADSFSQQPVEELRPVGFKPPWLPPMKYAKWEKDGDLNFSWDYQQLSDELATMTASYYEEATKFALEHNLPVPEVGGLVDRRIVSVLGHAPLSPEIPMAAAAGHPYLLGTPGAAIDPDLAAIIQQGVTNTGNDAKRIIEERVAAKIEALKSIPEPQVYTSTPAPQYNPLQPLTYQAFVAEGRRSGMSMADISLAWKAHKDALAEDTVGV